MQTLDRTGRTQYRGIIRQIAGLIAFLLAFVTVTASLHHHGEPASSAIVRAIQSGDHRIAGPGLQTASDATPKHALVSLSNAACVLCDWMATPFHPSSVAPLALFVALCTIVSLQIAVRLAALCAAPAPRLGLRAPPAH